MRLTAQVLPCLRHSDVAPFGRSDVMCSVHTPQAYIIPVGDIICEAYITRSGTERISLQKPSFVRWTKEGFCMVEAGRFELQTFRTSSERSNQLSYASDYCNIISSFLQNVKPELR